MAERGDRKSDGLQSTIHLTIDGRPLEVPPGTTIAAAVLMANHSAFRRSVSGQPRGPLCGMGVCFECRVTVDGEPHRRTCQALARDGMEVVTDAF
ncbi:MAG TPA: (2Fe-2S)-binding protein [Isosphaeraceae bacterium]|jgi:sarcosine oxidase subunit alpha